MTKPFYREFADYAGLRAALRDRIFQLNVSQSCLDSVAGTPPGYIGTLLAPFGRKKIGGVSLGLLVQAAGLKIALTDDPKASRKRGSIEALETLLRAAGLRMVLISDPVAAAKVERQYEQRNAGQVRLNNRSRAGKGKWPPRCARERERHAA